MWEINLLIVVTLWTINARSTWGECTRMSGYAFSTYATCSPWPVQAPVKLHSGSSAASMSQHFLKTEKNKMKRSLSVVLSESLAVSKWLDNSTPLLPLKIPWALYMLLLLSQKFMGKKMISKIAQEAAADSILFASSPQPVPLRHHFPFLEMWPLIHPIYIFYVSGWFLVVLVPSHTLCACCCPSEAYNNTE